MMLQKIYVLWVRQIKRYLRSRSRIFGSLAQPLLYLIALGYGFESIYQQAGQGNYINFLAPGITSMSIIFIAMFSGMEVIWDRQFGFLKETLVAPMPRLQIMIGRTLGGATVATIQGILVLSISILFGFTPISWVSLIPALGIMFLISLLFTALGTIVGSVLKDMQGFQLVMNFLVMPLFFLSGALFPLDGLPIALSIVTQLDPLSYGVDALRIILLGVGHYSMMTNMLVLSSITALLLFAGAHFFKKIEI